MHTIRLRSAWEIENGRGVRRFNKPTGLVATSRVYLAWDGPSPSAELNGEPIDKHDYCGPARFDVTARLLPANVLEMGTDNAAVLQTVRLVIEELDDRAEKAFCG